MVISSQAQKFWEGSETIRKEYMGGARGSASHPLKVLEDDDIVHPLSKDKDNV
jgi:hypothetical protein